MSVFVPVASCVPSLTLSLVFVPLQGWHSNLQDVWARDQWDRSGGGRGSWCWTLVTVNTFKIKTFSGDLPRGKQGPSGISRCQLPGGNAELVKHAAQVPRAYSFSSLAWHVHLLLVKRVSAHLNSIRWWKLRSHCIKALEYCGLGLSPATAYLTGGLDGCVAGLSLADELAKLASHQESSHPIQAVQLLKCQKFWCFIS